jgi:EAL domain-containing protein (putative c-di-GMP-specific phosphodiesterase class I)
MHDAEQSIETLRQLSDLGVHLSVDDFGTGYSSLSYLRRFPQDRLEIERAFIRNVATSRDHADARPCHCLARPRFAPLLNSRTRPVKHLSAAAEIRHWLS